MRHPLLLSCRDQLTRLVVTGGSGEFLVRGPDQQSTTFAFFPLGDGVAEVTVDGVRDMVHYAVDGEKVFLQWGGATFSFREQRHERSGEGACGSDDLRAPMPGQITSVFVEVGDTVTQGDPLYGLEAMKMETLVRAPHDATVSAIYAQAGAQIDGGAMIVELEPTAKQEGEVSAPEVDKG